VPEVVRGKNAASVGATTGAAAVDAQATDARMQRAVFDSAAALFGLLATPVRLQIISSLCQGELNVSQLLRRIDTAQPNMSQHLAALHRAGVLSRRREGQQVFYALGSEQVAVLCRTVVTQAAISMEEEAAAPVAADPSRRRRYRRPAAAKP
jgi:DNA-binding transcriptional ArsR family regulator